MLNDPGIAEGAKSDTTPAGVQNPTEIGNTDLGFRTLNNAPEPYDAYAKSGTRGLDKGPGVAESDPESLSKSEIAPLDSVDAPDSADRFAGTETTGSSVSSTANDLASQASTTASSIIDSVSNTIKSYTSSSQT